MKKILSLTLGIVLAATAFGQSESQAWSLEKCIAHAHENNLTIKQMMLKAQTSELTYKQSVEELAPGVSASTGYTYAVGRYLNPYTNNFDTESNGSLSMSLNASMILFDGMRTINTIKKNKTDMMTSQQAIERVKRSVSLEISLAYLAILRNEELMAAANAQLETTQKQVERTQRLVEAGSLPQGSLLEIKAQEAQEQTSLVDAQNNVALSKLTLAQMLDLDSPDGFEIEHPQLPDPSTDAVTVTLDEIYGQLDQLPEIKEATLAKESAERSLQIARAGYYPTLYLSGGISTGYSGSRMLTSLTGNYNEQPIGFVRGTNDVVYTLAPETTSERMAFGKQLRENRYDQIGLSLNIPIYSHGRVRAQVSAAKIGIMQAQTQIDQTKLSIFKSVQQALADAKAAQARYQSNNKTVEASAKAFEYTEQKFNVGAINTYEYNLAKTKLFQARSNLAQTKFDYIFRLKIIDFYRGMPIKI